MNTRNWCQHCYHTHEDGEPIRLKLVAYMTDTGYLSARALHVEPIPNYLWLCGACIGRIEERPDFRSFEVLS